MNSSNITVFLQNKISLLIIILMVSLTIGGCNCEGNPSQLDAQLLQILEETPTGGSQEGTETNESEEGDEIVTTEGKFIAGHTVAKENVL